MNAQSKEYLVDSPVTSKVKNFTLKELNADLVGVSNIERFEHAPAMMSPQGIMPNAKSVITFAVHHPDGCIEMGGMKHPQIMGPYAVQGTMNTRIDTMAYDLALYLESQGYEAVPIASSNIWRYTGYKDLKEQFAPDISHMHAAVAAGLAEFGYSGLAITPEYGARQRYGSVITNAVLTPTPLIEPGTICDNCMICRKHCLSGALSKEIDGWNVVKIEDKEYRYAKKNLWRCSWGEHFDLDLDLPIPEKVTEEVILENMKKHGMRGGEMGSCLRYCVPKAQRYFDKNYTNAPRRKRHVIPSEEMEAHRGLFEKVRAAGTKFGIDSIIVSSAARMENAGINLREYLPDGNTAITIAISINKKFKDTQLFGRAGNLAFQTAYDITRELERNGFSAVCNNNSIPPENIEKLLEKKQDGSLLVSTTVVTSAFLPETAATLKEKKEKLPKASLTSSLRRLFKEAGADLVGIASADLFTKTAKDLLPAFDGERLLEAKDKSMRFYPFEPEVEEIKAKVKKPSDYVENAKSVIVVGIHLPKATVECTARNAAEAMGPYAFAMYESANHLRDFAILGTKFLEDNGYEADWSFDMTGTASLNANPRGLQPDIFSNRFEAVAAGLGRLSKCGFVVTPDFGSNVRFVAIITDAPVDCDKPISDNSFVKECSSCDRCMKNCAVNAFRNEISVDIGRVSEKFHPIERIRCDWAKKYFLVAGEGNGYMRDNQTDIPAPENVTVEALDKALRQHHPVSKYRPCVFEKCAFSCPYTRTQI